MLRLDLRKLVSTMALSLLLCLPRLAMAEHLHEPTHEEVGCEICINTAAMAAAGFNGCIRTPKEPQKVEEKPTSFPLETFLLHKHQRGPPLLR